MTDSLQIAALSEAEFSELAEEWQDLLQRSDADGLFMSWGWQWLWWRHHRALLNARLRLFAVRSSDGRLVALVPLYEHRVRDRGIPIRRLELIGAAWGNDHAFYSEYLDFIVDRSAAQPVLSAVAEHIKSLSWDELILSAVLRDSHVAQLRKSLACFASIRDAEGSVAYRVSMSAGFDGFTRSLSGSIRRRLLNHRHRLHAHSFKTVGTPDLEPVLHRLSHFKRARWGARYADSPVLRAFELDLARHLLDRGQLQLTTLDSDGDVIAIMYNARVGPREYYLQSAFDPERARGLSLGYLHFGYAIEAAARASVTCFDFLAGGGLSTDYKRTLASQAVDLISYKAVRPGWLRALYSLHGRLRGLAGVPGK